jgi:chromosome segregation ATPase
MTGGTSGRDGSDRWEEKEVDRLRKRKTELEESIAKNKQGAPTKQQVVDLETRLKNVQSRVQYSEADLKVSEEKVRQLQQQKVLKEVVAGDLLKEITALKKEILSLEKRLKQLQQHTREVSSTTHCAISISFTLHCACVCFDTYLLCLKCSGRSPLLHVLSPEW